MDFFKFEVCLSRTEPSAKVLEQGATKRVYDAHCREDGLLNRHGFDAALLALDVKPCAAVIDQAEEFLKKLPPLPTECKFAPNIKIKETKEVCDVSVCA